MILKKLFVFATWMLVCEPFILSAQMGVENFSYKDESAITQSVDDADFYLRRAIRYTKQGDLKNAVADIESSLALDQSRGIAYGTAACIYFISKNYIKVLEYAKREIELLPDNAEGYCYKGMASLALVPAPQGTVQEKASVAIQSFTRAMELDSYSTRWYYWRGRAELLMGNWDEAYLARALADFRKDIEYNPQSYKGYYNAALVLSHDKSYKEALELLAQSIALKPDFVDALYLRAYCGLYAGTAEEVKEDCTAYISLVKSENLEGQEAVDLAAVYAMRAIVYRAEHRFEESIADFSEAIRLQPENGSLYGSRRSVYESAADQTKKASLKRKYLKLARRDDQMAKRLNAGKTKQMEYVVQGLKMAENFLPTLLETAEKEAR